VAVAENTAQQLVFAAKSVDAGGTIQINSMFAGSAN